MIRVLMFALAVQSALCGARADLLETIINRNEVVVGTKADYPPYGFKNEAGEIVGIEPDLAAELAKNIGVRLRLVPVKSSNRVEMLNTGQVDVVIATLSITEARRKEVGFIEPPYYASGAGVLFPAGLGITEVSDLAGKDVCGVEGNVFLSALNSAVKLSSLDLSDNVQQATKRLLARRCNVLYFDDSLLFYEKTAKPEIYKEYEFQQLIEIDPLLWGVAVKLGEEKGRFAEFVGKSIVFWHRSGSLLGFERKWLGGNTVMLRALKEKWTSLDRGQQ
jgi:polar amino acid transport system substrate-binding protein